MKATTLTAAQKTQLKALQAQVDTARQAYLTAAKNLKAFFYPVKRCNKFLNQGFINVSSPVAVDRSYF